jgi:choline/ethanolamine kinase
MSNRNRTLLGLGACFIILGVSYIIYNRSRRYIYYDGGKIHSDFLLRIPGWRNLDLDNVRIKPLTGGLTNTLLIVSANQKCPDGPEKVVMRIFGQTGGLINPVKERHVFRHRSTVGLRCYGEFPGGRFEEYLDADSLDYKEMSSPEVYRAVALLIAQCHTDSGGKQIVQSHHGLPDGRPGLFDLPSLYKEMISFNPTSSHDKNVLTDISALFNFPAEIKDLEQRIEQTRSPVVMCHNDTQSLNIMKSRVYHPGATTNKNFFLIDFEYASLNYRGFDLGNFLCEAYIDNSADAQV